MSEWIDLIKLLHIDIFAQVVGEMRQRYQENDRNASPVLIIYKTLEVSVHRPSPSTCMLLLRCRAPATH